MSNMLAVGNELGAHRAHKASGVRGVNTQDKTTRARADLQALLAMRAGVDKRIAAWRSRWKEELGERLENYIYRVEQAKRR